MATRVKILLIEPRLNFVSGRFGTPCSRLAKPNARWRRTFPSRATRTTPENRSAAAASAATFSIAASALASLIGGGGPARSEPFASSRPIPSRNVSGGGPNPKVHRVRRFPSPSVTTTTCPADGASTRLTPAPPISWRIPPRRFARAAAGCCRRPSGETAAEKNSARRSSLPDRKASKNAATRLPAAVSGKAPGGGSAAAAGPERPRARTAATIVFRMVRSSRGHCSRISGYFALSLGSSGGGGRAAAGRR